MKKYTQDNFTVCTVLPRHSEVMEVKWVGRPYLRRTVGKGSEALGLFKPTPEGGRRPS